MDEVAGDAERPLDARAARSRAAVLAAGVDLLVRDGWQAITQQRIAQESGVGRATVYRHWPTSTDLLLDVMGEALAGEVRTVEHSGDLRRDLTAELTAIADAVNDGPTLGVVATLIERSLTDEQHRSFHAQMTVLARQGVLAVVRTGIERGELDSELDDATAAAQTLGPLVYRRMLVPERISAEHVRIVVDAFLRSFGRSGG
ncbi:MAG: TetR/AcrR family transcriptional regulator [Actinomycetota bacterium]